MTTRRAVAVAVGRVKKTIVWWGLQRLRPVGSGQRVRNGWSTQGKSAERATAGVYTTRDAFVFMRRALRRFFNLCLFIFNRRFFMVLLRRMGCVKMVVCGAAVASRGTAVKVDDVRHGAAQRVFVKSTEKDDELTASGWLSFTAADEATTLPARRLMVVIRETNDRSILTTRLLEKDHSHTKTTKREAAQGSLVRSRQCLYVIKCFCRTD